MDKPRFIGETLDSLVRRQGEEAPTDGLDVIVRRPGDPPSDREVLDVIVRRDGDLSADREVLDVLHRSERPVCGPQLDVRRPGQDSDEVFG